MAFGALPTGQPGTWAIYDSDGQPAVDFDTFFEVSVKSDNKVAQAPVERGSFADYNKVATPKAIALTVGRTGGSEQLAAVLEQLDALADTTALVSVVTPERTYLDYNITAYDFARKLDNGVDRLLVSVTLQEIRQVDPQYSNEQIPIKKGQAKKPGDADTVDAGKQQGQEPERSTAERIRRGLFGGDS